MTMGSSFVPVAKTAVPIQYREGETGGESAPNLTTAANRSPGCYHFYFHQLIGGTKSLFNRFRFDMFEPLTQESPEECLAVSRKGYLLCVSGLGYIHRDENPRK
jgi:hypothetical protein